MLKRIFVQTTILVTFSALTLWAASITTVTKNPDPVGKYAKFELTVALGGTYTNPYDPTQIDLSAQFTAPSGKVWKINGFYNGSQYKIRFAANEVGNWTYVVNATDASGTASSPGGTFTVSASAFHGWVKVAPNKRYLMCDDGTSFYGMGPAYCWSVTQAGLGQLQAAGMNSWVYWNGTYDSNGGSNLFESVSSGIGKYDQSKCARFDSLINWSEADGLAIFLVIWPHDYLGSTMPGSWADKWSSNAYGSVVSCANFYTDATSWSYQQKLYRYLIARYGYSRALGSWQTVDEIQGTDGGASINSSSPATAGGNAWVLKMHDFFHANDPFNHPTNASLGGWWPYSDSVNDLSNTENYGSETATSLASIVQQMWNRFTKPAIIGESGMSDPHTNLWATLATGIAVTPLMWQFNQGWSASITAQFPPLAAFVKDIEFAGLTSPAQATVTVSGATAYGIKSDEVAFGWMTGSFSGKSLSVAGMANKTYTLTWFDCTAGTAISSSSVTVANGTLTATVPTTSVANIAFKALSPVSSPVQVAQGPGQVIQFRSAPNIAYENGALLLRGPIDENSAIVITTALGSTVARYTVTDAKVSRLPIRRLGQGVYFAGITSGNNKTMQRILVK
jgi:hypothetical protein